jgi:hypothetical protein
VATTACLERSPTVAAALPSAGAAAVTWTAPRTWTLVACLAFLFATAYAIAVVVFRLPLPGLQEPHLFRVSLALHVELAVFFWLTATMASLWAAAAEPAPGGASTRPSWLPLAAGLGTLLTVFSPLAGGTPLMADYFPWLTGNALFATGFALFTAAIAAAALGAVGRWLAGRERSAWRGAGLAALPVLAALLTALADVACGARNLIDIAWGAGHALLFAHVASMCWEWGRFCREGGGADGIQRAAAGVLAAVSLGLPVIPFVYAPGSAGHSEAFTWAMSWLLWPPALVAGLASARHFLSGRARATPLAPALYFGLAFAFFLVGNLLGTLITGPTTLVTAHYHASIGAVALTRMASTYHAVDVLGFGRPAVTAMRRQLLTYAVALCLLFSGLTLGAVDAAPRKTSAGELVTKGPYFKVGMSISGVGGLFAIAGSLWLLVNLLSPAIARREPAPRTGADDPHASPPRRPS